MQPIAENVGVLDLESMSGDALKREVCDLLENGEAWLETPNTLLRGRKPNEVIGTPDEPLVRAMLLAAVYGGIA